MAAKTHGTAYLYGIDKDYLSSAQVISISRTQSDKNNDFVEDKDGHVVASRHDDQTDTLEITARIESGFTRHTMAALVTLSTTGGQFDGSYRVTNIRETKSAKGWVDYAVTLVKDEYLTLS